MAVVKVIEIIAQSPTSWEVAAQEGLREASKTIHGIQSLYVKELQALVENDAITQYRLNLKVSFLVKEHGK